MKYKTITGYDLLNEMIAGNKDFRNIQLSEPNISMADKYIDKSLELLSRLENRNYGEGYDFFGSDLSGLVAPGFSFRGSNFHNTTLVDLKVPNGVFTYSNFINSNVTGLYIKGGSFCCNNINGCRFEDLDITDVDFFENLIKNSIFLRCKGIQKAKFISTCLLDNIVVDHETYQQFCISFPKHTPLIARDIPKGTKLKDGIVLDEGHKIINGDYYLNRSNVFKFKTTNEENQKRRFRL